MNSPAIRSRDAGPTTRHAAQTGIFSLCSHVLIDADGRAQSCSPLGSSTAVMWLVFLLSPLSVLVPSKKETEVHWRALGVGDAGEKVKGKDVGKRVFELQPQALGNC